MTTIKDQEEQEFQALLKGFSATSEPASISDAEAQASLERFLAREVVLNATTRRYEFASSSVPSVGQVISEYRRSNRLTVGELAQRVGMTADQLSKAELIHDPGDRPPEVLAKLIGMATGVGTLKAMRLVKEVATKAAAAGASDTSPVLLAARKAPQK